MWTAEGGIRKFDVGARPAMNAMRLALRSPTHGEPAEHGVLLQAFGKPQAHTQRHFAGVTVAVC
jgi:hypothetical protein